METLDTKIKLSDVLIPVVGPINFNRRCIKEKETKKLLSSEIKGNFANKSLALLVGQIYGYGALGLSIAYTIANYNS